MIQSYYYIELYAPLITRNPRRFFFREMTVIAIIFQKKSSKDVLTLFVQSSLLKTAKFRGKFVAFHRRNIDFFL